MAKSFRMRIPEPGRAKLRRARAAERTFPVRSQRLAESSRKTEIGGPEGPEPTRYGDWERKGICYDF